MNATDKAKVLDIINATSKTPIRTLDFDTLWDSLPDRIDKNHIYYYLEVKKDQKETQIYYVNYRGQTLFNFQSFSVTEAAAKTLLHLHEKKLLPTKTEKSHA